MQGESDELKNQLEEMKANIDEKGYSKTKNSRNYWSNIARQPYTFFYQH